MKKHYMSILILCCSTQLQGQSYYPMLDSIYNIWTYVANLAPVRNQQPAAPCDYNNFLYASSEIYTANDTVIGSENYKVLYLKDINSGMADCLYGYLREDTAGQKIYFIDYMLSPAVLLYDFSMQVGDSINFDFFSSWGFYYQDGYYHLDSISTINIKAGNRRIFYLSIPGVFSQYPMEWIESVGHPGHLVYPYSLNFSAGIMFSCNDPIARDFYSLLTCFEQASSKVYFDSCAHDVAVNNWCFNYVDSCNYWNICGSLEEHGFLTEFKIAPNPSSEKVTLFVEAKRNADARLEVLDVSGKIVMKKRLILQQGVNENDLATDLLESGSYLVVLRFDEGAVYRKLVLTPR